MKRSLFTLLVLVFSNYVKVIGQSFPGRIVLGEQFAEGVVKKTLSIKERPFYGTLISDKEMAIAVAEPMLFKFYGQENIIEERPYEVYLIKGYWYITGTLPIGYKGGTFLIITNSANGQVVKISHGK